MLNESSIKISKSEHMYVGDLIKNLNCDQPQGSSSYISWLIHLSIYRIPIIFLSDIFTSLYNFFSLCKITCQEIT